MNRASKAALLAALVFPGAGHFYLRLYGRGLVLALASLAALYVIGVNAAQVVQVLLAKLQTGRIPPDLFTLTREVLAQMRQVGPSLRGATLVLTLCWVAGILDAHRSAAG